MFNPTLFDIDLSARYDYITGKNQNTQRNLQREFSKPSRPTALRNYIRFFN